MITYTIADFEETDRTTEVTYTNADGHTHVRVLNIPHLEDGTIDQEYWQEILEGQLRGVENKIKVNAISFVDPNAEPDDSVETPTDPPPDDTAADADETSDTTPPV